MYAIQLKDYENRLESLNNLLNDLLDKRKEKLSAFDNLVGRLRELYIELLKQKVYELLKIRTHFLDDLATEEKKLKDLANRHISELDERVQLLKKKIEELHLYYDNKLMEKRREVEEKKKKLREELSEKIAEVESNHKYLLEFLSLKERLIEVSNKYLKLEKALGISSQKSINLDEWICEKEKLKNEIDLEKESVRKNYEKAIKELHDELASIERERDKNIEAIQRSIEELYNKMMDIAIRTDKQVLEIQDGYRKNIFNVDIVIEESRKLIEGMEKKELDFESLKEFSSLTNLMKHLDEINKEIEELQKQIDENNKKLDNTRREIADIQCKLENEKHVLYTRYENQRTEYL
ncbi:MAG: hypothetical protein N3A69_13670, partial [Leptospiraceae bacterium]|nr:hypothetical protein [Leptospiraceae bacterium]